MLSAPASRRGLGPGTTRKPAGPMGPKVYSRDCANQLEYELLLSDGPRERKHATILGRRFSSPLRLTHFAFFSSLPPLLPKTTIQMKPRPVGS